MGSEVANYRDYSDSQSGVYPDETFQGTYEELWDDTTLRYRGVFELGGKKVGLHLLFWPNGMISELAYWIQGFPVGTMIRFREDGSREMERDYGETGGSVRSWIEKRYGYDNRLISVTETKSGIQISDWVEPTFAAMLQEVYAELNSEEESRKCEEERKRGDRTAGRDT